MRRPNTFIIGAPRCGTTAWVTYLSGHREIAFSRQKEPHYFCTDFPRFRWARTEPAYLDQFAEAGRARVVAEASVQYLYSQTAVARIRAFDPAARILIFLRDQRSFLPSYHAQLSYNGDEELPFAQAWRQALSGPRVLPKGCREPAFLDYPAVGRFDAQVARVLKHFPPEQVHIERYEVWTQDPRAAYLRVLRFLDLPDDGRRHFPAIHGRKRHRWLALARLTQRPPPWALALSAALRRATGRARLGLAGPLRWLNRAPEGCAGASPVLLEEIDRHFAASNARLARLIAQVEASR